MAHPSLPRAERIRGSLYHAIDDGAPGSRLHHRQDGLARAVARVRDIRRVVRGVPGWPPAHDRYPDAARAVGVALVPVWIVGSQTFLETPNRPTSGSVIVSGILVGTAMAMVVASRLRIVRRHR